MIALTFASYLAHRLKNRTNVVWILGGDRPARLAGMHNDSLQKMGKDAGFPADQNWTPIWREIARGIADGLERKPAILYHPQGGAESSSVFLHTEPWLSVNGMQSGHGGGHDVPVWEWVARDYAMNPAKPTLDLEPNYEDHPYNPWPQWDAGSAYGETYLWNYRQFLDRTTALWVEIARRYRGDATIAGYNLLCEPVTGNVPLLNEFYLNTIRAIRKVDTDHLIMLDPNLWAKDIASLHDELFSDPQVMPVAHHYFSETPAMAALTSYPAVVDGKKIDRSAVEKGLDGKYDQQRIARPVMFSEFGVMRSRARTTPRRCSARAALNGTGPSRLFFRLLAPGVRYPPHEEDRAG